MSNDLYRGKEILQVLQSFLHDEVGLPNPVKYFKFPKMFRVSQNPQRGRLSKVRVGLK